MHRHSTGADHCRNIPRRGVYSGSSSAQVHAFDRGRDRDRDLVGALGIREPAQANELIKQLGVDLDRNAVHAAPLAPAMGWSAGGERRPCGCGQASACFYSAGSIDVPVALGG
jgi:hypothetical protein